MKPKEYYERHPITISEQLARQYANMRRSEILLHQYILSIVNSEGIVKRNMSAAAREIGCSRRWLYEAETSLLLRELLSTQGRNGRRYWKVFQGKAIDKAEGGDEEVEEDDTPVVSIEEIQDDVEPKRHGFFSFLWRLKDEK